MRPDQMGGRHPESQGNLRLRAKLGSEIILRQAISSVQTLKLINVFGPNVWVIGTSEASRP